VRHDFEQLHSMHSKRLFYIAYSVTKDRFLAEDVVQETFLKAFKKMDTIDNVEKVGAWLSSIAARTAIDFIRTEKRKRWVPADQNLMEKLNWEVPSEMNTEKEVEARLLEADLNKRISCLASEYRDILLLKVKFGLKEQEIAGLLQLKSATVKTRLYRARKQLKQSFLEKYSA